MTRSHWDNLGNGKLGKVHDIIGALCLEPLTSLRRRHRDLLLVDSLLRNKSMDFAQPLGNPVVSAPADDTTSAIGCKPCSSNWLHLPTFWAIGVRVQEYLMRLPGFTQHLA